MATVDWDAFHARAKAAVPPQDLPPKRYWIGVLLHDKSPEDKLEELDFVWMKAHSKIKLSKIHETYSNRYAESQFKLLFQNETPAADVIVKDLNHYNDNVVIMRAIDLHPRPLQPTTHQVPAAPSVKAEPKAASPLPPATPIQSAHQDTTAGAENNHTSPPRPVCTPNSITPPNDENMPPSWDMLRDHITPPSVNPVLGQQTARPAPLLAHEARDPWEPQQLNVQQPGFNYLYHSLQPLGGVQPESTPPFPHILPSPTIPMPSGSTPPISHESPHTVVRPEFPPIFLKPTEESTEVFDPESVFNCNPSQETYTQEEESKPIDFSIRCIIEQDNVGMLETSVAQSLEVLEALRKAFYPFIHSTQDAQPWIQAIDKLIPQAERKRTVVGVVGNTGAGKSSVINALLDEERLVPTNCMRACTAVVTEISWNFDSDPFSKYRAEIEFISQAEWERELTLLMKEMLTENGTLSKDAADQNTDAGIAWAKFQAVYPSVTRDMLPDCTVDDLLSAPQTRNILGTTKKINQSQPERFYQELQKYVDSKEKVTGKNKGDDKKQKPKHQMEYWPLIKVVKIYTKSPALSTGAVIVDLPGVHDSNAARAAVAQGYLKQCTGLWIVAPITRAVDDKAAKTLLGDSFKRQLKYDGGYSSVTFICSKTDDISITEAIDSLELEDQVSDLEKQKADYEQEIQNLKDQMSEVEESIKVYKAAQTEASDDIDIWDELKDRVDDGDRVFAPSAKSNKRKPQGSGRQSRKRRRQSNNDDSDHSYISSDDDCPSETDNDSNNDDVQAPQEPLTKEDVKSKLEELRETKKNARRRVTELKHSLDNFKPKIRDIKAKIADINTEISFICIAGRNEYSKTAIQNDFAAGIKELDQENAAEEDEENFNPDEEMRDYESVARSLPVFCVSSRAYQKMSGRLRKDGAVPGFKTMEETEVPQLQNHCKKLTEAGRIQTCRTFLLSFCQQLITFSLWASDDGTCSKITDADKRRHAKNLEKRLKELENGLEGAIHACINAMKKEMKDQIFDKYPELIQEAIEAAPATAQKWAAHRSDGGLYWATYKAVVRRNGAYSSASAGYRDFNAELVDPIVKKLANSWERAFQNRLPKVFETYTQDTGKILHRFHETIEESVRDSGVGLAHLTMLKNQITAYEQIFAQFNNVLITNMNELQRNANRDFTPTIGRNMEKVYGICTAECGPGSYMRMKQHMSAYVDQNRYSMFTAAANTVAEHLNRMCKDLSNLMEARADDIFVRMRDDYMRVVGGTQVNPQERLSQETRALMSEVKSILDGVESRFEPIANGESEVRGHEQQVMDIAADNELVNNDVFHTSTDDADADDFLPAPEMPGAEIDINDAHDIKGAITTHDRQQ